MKSHLQRFKKTTGRAPRILSGFGLIVAVAALPATVAADTVRSSPNYGIQFDVLASGGGASESASYSQLQTVIGQSVIWTSYTSSSFEFQPVGTLLIPDASRVTGWSLY